MNEFSLESSSVVELSIASREEKSILNDAFSPPTTQKLQSFEDQDGIIGDIFSPSVEEFPSNEELKSRKTGEMSDFSYIVQEGLQNARRQSQQELAKQELISQYERNTSILTHQLEEMQNLLRIRILKEEEDEISQKATFLLNFCQRFKKNYEKSKHSNPTAKKGRLFSPSYYQQENFGRSQLAYFLRKKQEKGAKPYGHIEKKSNNKGSQLIKRSKSCNKKSVASTQKFEGLKASQAINKRKILLKNRMNVIKQCIIMTIQSNRDKAQKLSCQNKILKEELKIMSQQAVRLSKKSVRKQNRNTNVDYTSKNLKQLVYGKEKSLGFRKASLLNRSKSKSNMQSCQSLSKKKIRIKSSQNRKDSQPTVEKIPLIQHNVRDEYFDKNDRVRNYCQESPLAINQYY